jgi:hypothetical protein
VNEYLARLRALNFEKSIPQPPSKPSKPGFECFEGGQGMGFSKNHVPAEKYVISALNEKGGDSPRLISSFSFNSYPETPEGPFAKILAALEARCPDYVEPQRWHQAIEDGRRFLAQWDQQATALGWTSRDLFGLHKPPASPHPSYSRVSRYDDIGLVWLLEGCRVVALTDSTAAIQNVTGNITVYRRHHNPALGPLGDSLDDFMA